MNKKFIERHLSQIKELARIEGLNINLDLSKFSCNEKFGGFEGEYFRFSFYSKWVWPNKFGSKNFINVGGRKLYWSYHKDTLWV